MRSKTLARQVGVKRVAGIIKMSPNNPICIGVIAAPHGIRGAVTVKSYTESLDLYNRITNEAGDQEYKLDILHYKKAGIVVQIKGVKTREQAEALRGTKLYVSRETLPETAENEYYHADLIGLEAVLSNGIPYGIITNVHNYGAGDILEIKRTDGTQELLPFTNDCVGEVDEKSGKVTITPPEAVVVAKEKS